MDPVTGDAPQPGETPRTEGNPWSFDPDAAWWRGEGDREQAEALAETAARPRHPRRRTSPGGSATPTMLPLAPEGVEPGFAGEAVDAHAAGVQDAAQALTSDDTADEPPAAVLVEAERAETIEDPEAETATRAEPVAVERDHDERTGDRYRLPDQDEERTTEPPERAEDVPEVMVLPEPDRNRPTVPLERGAVPGQPSGTARQDRASAADVKRSRMENSPFWLSEEERAVADGPPSPEVRDRQPLVASPAESRRGVPQRRRPRRPRPAAPGLFGLIALGLIAAFFSWVSAEPFWLAVGHGDHGVATVARCTGSGVTQRCAGSFAAADGSYSVETVTLLGVSAAGRHPGAVAPARMVSPQSQQAYVGGTGTLVQLRWLLGFVLVLLCGLGIAALTGTRQLETIRARRGALLMSLAGPVLLLAGFLFATY
jgi:hypothetical protein